MLASLVSASREFIGIADLEGNALYVNEAGRKLRRTPRRPHLQDHVRAVIE